MGVTDWGEINQPLGAPALGGAGGWADSVAQALNNSDTTVDARLATLEAAMVAKSGGTMTGNLSIAPPSSTSALTLKVVAGSNAIIYGYQDDIQRYSLRIPDNGGYFRVYGYNDDGSGAKVMLTGNGNTGLFTVYGVPTTSLGIATKGYVDTLAVAAFNAGRVDAGMPTLSDAEARTRLGIEGE